MRFCLIFILSFIALSSCKSSKTSKKEKTNSHKVVVKTTNNITYNTTHLTKKNLNIAPSEYSDKAFNIVDFAKQFEGVKYKFGGTSKAGMDCSGLVYKSFKAYDINLPRISRDMAKRGHKVSLENVQLGDLLFFKTNNNRNTINHVGLVITALPGNIEFIHSTTSQGVIISSLAERYWYFSFVEARRIL